MTAAAETGRAGERAATEYLRRAGYEICALNWRQGRYELDIVACREGVLHFVEVKTRRSGSLTPPEAAATQRKFRALSRAAACYLRTVGWEGEVQRPRRTDRKRAGIQLVILQFRQIVLSLPD